MGANRLGFEGRPDARQPVKEGKIFLSRGNSSCKGREVNCLGGFKITQSSVQVVYLRLSGKLLNFSKLQFPYLKNEGHSTVSMNYCKVLSTEKALIDYLPF